MENITFLNVKYEDKEEAKFLGCRFDGNIKKWYIKNYHENYETVISKFKDVKKELNIKKFKLTDDDNICPICYENIENKTILKCGHQFCLICIIKSCKDKFHYECSLCRKFIFKL